MYRVGLKFRLWTILASLIVLCGCATVSKECKESKELFPATMACESGYMNPFTAITGHPMECLTVDELRRIQKECPNWR
jgi:hypothetical protein